MSLKKLSAIGVERLFIVGIIALLCFLIADFIFVTNLLKNQVKTTDHTNIMADISDDDIANVSNAGAWLARHPDDVQRVNSVVAQSKLYQYQNQIIADIEGYANRTGISVTSYAFVAPTNSPQATQSTSTSPAAPSSATTAPTTAEVPKLPGVNTINVNVTLGQNTNYINFLRFLRLLEKNVTRMQVTSISLTPDTTTAGAIGSPTINLLVYTK